MPDTPEPVRGRSPGAAWTRVTHGVHVPGPDRDTLLRGWQLLLPEHGCFTHLTAAESYGWWVPPMPDGLPVWASLGQRDPRPLRSGIQSVRLAQPCEPVLIDDVRLAPIVEVLLACAQDLGLVDLVVLIDGAMHAGSITQDDLSAQLAALRRRRGLPQVRSAFDLADARSESPWETLLRLLHVVCGIEVEPQHEVDGTWGLAGRGDLWIVGTRTLQEYDGDVHLPRAAQKRDLRRARRLDAAGWTRHGYTDNDVLARAVTIVRDADLALGREHRPDVVRAWHALLRESMFTPAGRDRLLRRTGGKSTAQPA